MRNALCCFFVLVSGILSLTAEPEADGGERQGAGRRAWFACLSKPEGLEDPVMLLAGDKLTSLALPEFMASGAVKIPADGILRIVRVVPDPADPAKRKYLVLAEAIIPEGVREALVILSPLEKPKGDLIFQNKVQDLAKFKGGDRLFINMSDTNIGVKIGDSSVTVPAGQANIYSAPKLADSTNTPIIYSYYHPEQKKWKLLTASTVVIMPTRREIVVFNNGNRIGKIKKHGILFPVSPL